MTDYEFRITFGGQYDSARPHPHHELAHRDGWFTVLVTGVPADRTRDDAEVLARIKVGNDILKGKWSNMYDAATHGADEHFYPFGELHKFVVPYTDTGSLR